MFLTFRQTNAKASDLPKIFPNRWLEGNVEDYKALIKEWKLLLKRMVFPSFNQKKNLAAQRALAIHLTKEVALNPRNSERQNVKTLIHELAHAKLHTKESRSKLYSCGKRVSGRNDSLYSFFLFWN